MSRITKNKSGDITTINLSGPLDVDCQDMIEESIVHNLGGSTDSIILSLKGVTSISSFGVGMLVNACGEIEKQGRIIKLINVGPNVLDKFHVYKVLPVFHIFSDFESARRQIEIDIEEKGQNYVRLFERLNVELRARFRVFKRVKESIMHGFQNALAKSLSKHGMYLKTEDEVEENTLLEVKLSLPGGIFKKEQVKFLGKVVRKSEGDNNGFGLCILHMDEVEKARLEHYLEEHDS